VERIADLHSCVDAVSAYVRAHVTYLPGATSVEATAQEAGTWRGCLSGPHARHHWPAARTRDTARYVSGYLFPLSDAEVGEVVAGQSHAWIEYFSGAWTGMDRPTAFRDERHIIVATVETTTTCTSQGVYQVRPLPVWASSWR